MIGLNGYCFLIGSVCLAAFTAFTVCHKSENSVPLLRNINFNKLLPLLKLEIILHDQHMKGDTHKETD